MLNKTNNRRHDKGHDTKGHNNGAASKNDTAGAKAKLTPRSEPQPETDALATQALPEQQITTTQPANGAERRQDHLATQPIPNVEAPPETPDGNGNGAQDSPGKGVRPVTARVGEGFVREYRGVGPSATGHQGSQAHSTADLRNGNGNGNSAGNGQKAR